MSTTKTVRRVQGLRSSHAAGTHPDRRTRRIRTRADATRRAIKEQR